MGVWGMWGRGERWTTRQSSSQRTKGPGQDKEMEDRVKCSKVGAINQAKSKKPVKIYQPSSPPGIENFSANVVLANPSLFLNVKKPNPNQKRFISRKSNLCSRVLFFLDSYWMASSRTRRDDFDFICRQINNHSICFVFFVHIQIKIDIVKIIQIKDNMNSSIRNISLKRRLHFCQFKYD